MNDLSIVRGFAERVREFESGRLTDEQQICLTKVVTGRVVHDLGCGRDFGMNCILRHCGAIDVIGVDKDQNSPFAKGTYVQSTFQDYRTEAIDVAFVSWPTNNGLPGLVDLLKKAKTVVYIGKNTDGSCCGNEDFFKYMLTRKLVRYRPNEHNTMIVVGAPRKTPRCPTHEEFCGMDVVSIHPYVNM